MAMIWTVLRGLGPSVLAAPYKQTAAHAAGLADAMVAEWEKRMVGEKKEGE